MLTVSHSTRARVRDLDDWVSQCDDWTYTRRRWYPWPVNPVLTTTVWNGEPTYVPGYSKGQQYTADENHGLQLPISVAKGDVGGNFYSTKQGVHLVIPETQHLYGEVFPLDAKVRGDYYGYFAARDPATLLVPTWTDENLTPKGTTAVARCKPTNNVADASVFLGEILREGLPNLLGVSSWENRASVARSAGSEYLNSEFGWMPLMRDVRSFAYAVANANRILSQYERDAGKVVRRRYEFPIEKSLVSTFVSTSDGYVPTPTVEGIQDPSGVRGSLYKETRTWKRTWFSGAFTYHLPVGYKSRQYLVKAAAKAGPLLGLELTPDALWNLTPWTWALDWFSNAGDVVTNLSDWATDGLVMRYGYIMQHELRSDTYHLVGPSRFRPTTARPSPVVAWREVKRRQRATPFGFGVEWSTFTPRQLAIAAALGITRVF